GTQPQEVAGHGGVVTAVRRGATPSPAGCAWRLRWSQRVAKQIDPIGLPPLMSVEADVMRRPSPPRPPGCSSGVERRTQGWRGLYDPLASRAPRKAIPPVRGRRARDARGGIRGAQRRGCAARGGREAVPPANEREEPACAPGQGWLAPYLPLRGPDPSREHLPAGSNGRQGSRRGGKRERRAAVRAAGDQGISAGVRQ